MLSALYTVHLRSVLCSIPLIICQAVISPGRSLSCSMLSVLCNCVLCPLLFRVCLLSRIAFIEDSALCPLWISENLSYSWLPGTGPVHSSRTCLRTTVRHGTPFSRGNVVYNHGSAHSLTHPFTLTQTHTHTLSHTHKHIYTHM
jgi:hypothetical protein